MQRYHTKATGEKCFDLRVDGSSVDFGTFAMSGKNFLEAYLLRKLRPLNKILESSVKWLTLQLY
jgi:hypothetical protein